MHHLTKIAMKEKIYEFLKHPIWSNVIAAFIVLGITIGYNFAISIFKNTDFITEFLKFWNYKIQLWIVILLIIVFLLMFKFLSKNKTNQNSFEYDNETLELDRKLFEKIRTEIMDENVALNLKNNSFSSYPFDIRDLDFIHDFTQQEKNPNFEFSNPNIENIKESLIKSLDELQDALSRNIFGTDIKHPTKTFIGIPKEWDYEKIEKARISIENAEKSVFVNYEKLIKTGRRILKI